MVVGIGDKLLDKEVEFEDMVSVSLTTGTFRVAVAVLKKPERKKEASPQSFKL